MKMKITITPAGGAPFVLADDAAGATVADGFRPEAEADRAKPGAVPRGLQGEHRAI